VNELEFKQGLALINKAHEKILDDKMWDKWVSIYPNMDDKTFVSFEDFKKQHFSNVNSKGNKKISKQEIIEKAERIKDKHLGRKRVRE
jgi:hypothetical protein